MKNQDDKFLKKRAKIRRFLTMSELKIKKSTYMKLMGQVVNGVKDAPLQDWEVFNVDEALIEVVKAIEDFRSDLQDTIEDVETYNQYKAKKLNELHSKD